MPTDAQYRRLARFRHQLRVFDQWSRSAATEHGLTHAQHQLLLAVRGSTTPEGPTVGEIAEALLVRRHTATELVDRVQQLGLIERHRDAGDHRRVHLSLTDAGERALTELTSVHLAELRRLAALLGDL